jgi:hypothetical protein
VQHSYYCSLLPETSPRPRNAVAIVLALVFRLEFRTSLLASLLLAPFDEMAYIFFLSAHKSGLLTERACAIGLTMISFSFIVSPVLINIGCKLADRFTTEPKPDLPLKALNESIHDHVIVVGYGYIGRVICILLKKANVPYIAFERSLDRLEAATVSPTFFTAWVLSLNGSNAIILLSLSYEIGRASCRERV